MKTISLRPQGVKKILSGRLWLEKRDLTETAGLEPGALARLVTKEGQFAALAYVNPKSKIIARIFSRKEERPDRNFFLQRFKTALKHRQAVYPNEKCFRLIHGEGDLLPGLTIDVYEKVCVVQLSTAGMEGLKEEIFRALRDLLEPQAIVLKNDLPARREEGLPLYVDLEGRLEPPIKVMIDGLFYLIDPLSGQKTGFFLDQRENRRRLARYVSGKVVLDLYCYTGAFALTAAMAGAKKVLAVDRSESALALAQENAKLNGLKEKIVFLQDEAEKFLSYAPEAEVLILDPPAFIKHHRHFRAGYNRYFSINRLAMAKLKPEGILFSSSCSQFLSLNDLKIILQRTTDEYQRYAQILEYGIQALDHPTLLTMPETMYLKALFIRVF